MNKQLFSVAIDGPGGAGKSSVAIRVAGEMNALHLDTGAMYRAVGLYMLRNEVPLTDEEAISDAVEGADVTVKYEDGRQKTLLLGEDVSDLIRTAEVSGAASAVATVEKVRRCMVAMQRKIASGISLVMDGRDIGTVVLPDATVKVYLTASNEVRAMRRFLEEKKKDPSITYEEVLSDLIARDKNDTTRAHSPLMKAADAVEIDSSDMTEDEVTSRIIALLNEKLEVENT
ncbi:MAG: (d)CMP kinase [Clostridia bacterium]|nr:(d)CMP kinase [Clostridia bacterium]